MSEINSVVTAMSNLGFALLLIIGCYLMVLLIWSGMLFYYGAVTLVDKFLSFFKGRTR